MEKKKVYKVHKNKKSIYGGQFLVQYLVMVDIGC